ncbi:hypothetical protein JCM10908_006852 [Rhodotorula pacifica]|uniref:uncharacterized protein n=1 Tax=Rhodotorula pacifica TaxID=1495444 RepID=UPI00316FB58C
MPINQPSSGPHSVSLLCLPDELLQHIASRLPRAEQFRKKQSLVCMALVSKRLRAAALPYLWEDLSYTRKDPTDPTEKQIFCQYGKLIKRLYVTIAAATEVDTVTRLLGETRILDTLSLSCYKRDVSLGPVIHQLAQLDPPVRELLLELSGGPPPGLAQLLSSDQGPESLALLRPPNNYPRLLPLTAAPVEHIAKGIRSSHKLKKLICDNIELVRPCEDDNPSSIVEIEFKRSIEVGDLSTINSAYGLSLRTLSLDELEEPENSQSPVHFVNLETICLRQMLYDTDKLLSAALDPKTPLRNIIFHSLDENALVDAKRFAELQQHPTLRQIVIKNEGNAYRNTDYGLSSLVDHGLGILRDHNVYVEYDGPATEWVDAVARHRCLAAFKDWASSRGIEIVADWFDPTVLDQEDEDDSSE